MGIKRDYTGIKKGKLTFLRFVRMEKKPTYQYAVWECECDCGNIVEINSKNVLNGSKISCENKVHLDEYQKKRWDSRGRKHGRYWNHPLYHTWLNMYQRCHVESSSGYKNYGKRGIEVCAEWRESAEPFIEHLESIGWSKDCGLSIDRINNNGNYCPENVKLSNYIEQSNNKRTNTYITYKSEIKTLANWARYFGVPYARLHYRLRSGWSVQEAFSDCKPCDNYDPNSRLFK